MAQFRRSKKFGPFRISVSKKGIGYSFGNSVFRVGRGTDGKTRRTLRLPGTGLYDIKTIGTTRPESATGGRTLDAVIPDAYRVGPFRYGEIRLPSAITFHGYGGTIDFDGYTVSIGRGVFMRLMGRRSIAFPITAVHEVGTKEPTRLRNGYIRFLVPAPDGTVTQPLEVAKDLHAVMVPWQKRTKVDALHAALAAAEKAGGDASGH